MKLKSDVVFEQEIKKSKFITYLHPVDNEDQAREFLKQIKKEHPGASHHCTALKLSNTMRSNDDGEPSGTAGRPMLDVLANHEADGIYAVVVRYFGGTLLGKGGLVKAYSSSVSNALQQAQFLEETSMQVYELCFEYSMISKIDACLAKNDFELLEARYLEKVIYYIACKEDPSEEILKYSSGQVKPLYLQEMLRQSDCLSHN